MPILWACKFLTVMGKSMLFSILTRSMDDTKAQNVPVRPPPSLKLKIYSYNICVKRYKLKKQASNFDSTILNKQQNIKGLTHYL